VDRGVSFFGEFVPVMVLGSVLFSIIPVVENRFYLLDPIDGIKSQSQVGLKVAEEGIHEKHSLLYE
jgi:hypothetical protein